MRGVAVQLGALLLAGVLILTTRSSLAAALALGPVSPAAQALVGLGIGATLAGAAALAVLATPWGQAEQIYLARAASDWTDLLVHGLLAGGCAALLFQAALQPLVGLAAAAALFALSEALFGGFLLFRGGCLANSLIALTLGLVTGWLALRFGLAAALLAQIAFRMIFLALVRPALAQVVL
jgi:hypothetical protein